MNSARSASPFATAPATSAGALAATILAFIASPMPRRSNTLIKCLPLTLSGKIETALALSSVCLNASAEDMSGFGAPARTAAGGADDRALAGRKKSLLRRFVHRADDGDGHVE